MWRVWEPFFDTDKGSTGSPHSPLGQPGTPQALPWEPTGTLLGLIAPLPDYKKNNVLTNIQRQKLSIGAQVNLHLASKPAKKKAL